MEHNMMPAKPWGKWLEFLFPSAMALLGVCLGFWLNSCSDERAREHEYSKIRAAIKLEIGRNDKLMRNVWEAVDEINIQETARSMPSNVGADETAELLKYEAFEKILDHANPQWSRIVWENYIDSAAIALDSELFQDVYQHYDNLSKLTNLCTSILKQRFMQDSRELWKKTIEIVKKTKSLNQSIKVHL